MNALPGSVIRFMSQWLSPREIRALGSANRTTHTALLSMPHEFMFPGILPRLDCLRKQSEKGAFQRVIRNIAFYHKGEGSNTSFLLRHVFIWPGTVGPGTLTDVPVCRVTMRKYGKQRTMFHFTLQLHAAKHRTLISFLDAVDRPIAQIPPDRYRARFDRQVLQLLASFHVTKPEVITACYGKLYLEDCRFGDSVLASPDDLATLSGLMFSGYTPVRGGQHQLCMTCDSVTLTRYEYPRYSRFYRSYLGVF